MLDVAYICDKNKECRDHVSCGVDCCRTHDPTYAANRDSVSIIADLISTFDIIGDAKLIEKEKKDD